MTTTPKLTKLAKGHGLTQNILDGIYDKRIADVDTDDVVIVAILRPVGHGDEKGKRHVTFEPIRFEPVTDPDEASRIRMSIADAYEARTSAGTLPLDYDGRGDEEKRQFLLAAIEDWAAEHDHTDIDVRDVWTDYYGDKISADWRSATERELREFALAKGALAEETAGSAT